MAMLIENTLVITTVIIITTVMGFPLVLDQSGESKEKNTSWIYDEDNHVQKRPCREMSTTCGSELPIVVIRRNSLHNGTARAGKMNEGVKKNVFTSWGWGAEGMPFSVLYLNRKSRVHYPPKAGQPLSETMPQPMAMTAEHPQYINYQKVSPRNTLGTRRHYSIIPQLFVSYGWGPIGK